MVLGVESDTAMTSSSNAATEKIEKKDIPMMTDYWKKSIVIEAESSSYFTMTGWLLGGVESSISDLEFPTVDNITVICFESHLIVRLDLPPSKFLVSILDDDLLRCELAT
jgi:hypothetical protein